MSVVCIFRAYGGSGRRLQYDFRVTAGSREFSAALHPPESSSPSTAEIDSGTEECALGKQSAPLTV